VYRVESAEGSRLVYVAGTGDSQWMFSNGEVYRGAFGETPRQPRRAGRPHAAQAIAAPMPALVVKVLVVPGQAVAKGDTVVVLEAMKMELPMRAAAAAVVSDVRCREGELVQADAVLVEF
jgi:biotin carboxyl carrier protein